MNMWNDAIQKLAPQIQNCSSQGLLAVSARCAIRVAPLFGAEEPKAGTEALALCILLAARTSTSGELPQKGIQSILRRRLEPSHLGSHAGGLNSVISGLGKSILKSLFRDPLPEPSDVFPGTLALYLTAVDLAYSHGDTPSLLGLGPLLVDLAQQATATFRDGATEADLQAFFDFELWPSESRPEYFEGDVENWPNSLSQSGLKALADVHQMLYSKERIDWDRLRDYVRQWETDNFQLVRKRLELPKSKKITCDSLEGNLMGETFDGESITGIDNLRMLQKGAKVVTIGKRP